MISSKFLVSELKLVMELLGASAHSQAYVIKREQAHRAVLRLKVRYRVATSLCMFKNAIASAL